MRSIAKLMRGFIDGLWNCLELRKYNRFTIAEYFRMQGAQIGEGSSIIPNSLGNEPYLVKIGNHVTIAQGVHCITHDGGTWILRNEFPNIQGFGPITIEDNCVIGWNAAFFQGNKQNLVSQILDADLVISSVN